LGLTTRSKRIGSWTKPKELGPERGSIRLGLGSCVRTQFWWVRRQDPLLIGLERGSIRLGLGSCVRTQFWWVRHQDPLLVGPTSGPTALGSHVWTQPSWILLLDPSLLGPALELNAPRPGLMDHVSGSMSNLCCFWIQGWCLCGEIHSNWLIIIETILTIIKIITL